MTVGKADKYPQLVGRFVGRRGVSVAGRGFGADALKYDGKIFAMLSSRGRFVVKLPRSRVDELVTEGAGNRFDPGHGRLMKEWFELSASSRADWSALADEALRFARTRSA